MSFDLTGAADTYLVAEIAGAVNTGAFTLLVAKKQRSDRNANTCIWEAKAADDANAHTLVSTGDGTSFHLFGNWAQNVAPPLGSGIDGNVGEWEWTVARGDGAQVQQLKKADLLAAPWIPFGDPIPQTQFDVAEWLFGNNRRDEGFDGLQARITLWAAAKSIGAMNPEIASETVIDTEDLVLFKLGVGADLAAALAAGVGTMTYEGSVTLSSDMPATLAAPPAPPPVYFNPQHYITNKGWANTKGHASGPGGTYDILRVTNLNASGPGSLKAAAESSGARLIVFEVGGEINQAATKITVTDPYMTIAGQTAPSPGITITRGMIENATHDCIYSHLSLFPGTEAASGADCFQSIGGSYNVIVDHCAGFWGRDGNIDVSGYPWDGANVDEWRENTSHQVTVSASVIAENFGSGGSLISDNTTKILNDRNYYYACRGRNGHFKGGVHATSANCLIYNPADKFFDNTLNLAGQSGDSTETHESYIDLIGNVCKAGPSTTAVSLFRLVSNEDVNLYLSDNEAKDEEGDDYPATSVSTTLGAPFGAINAVGSPSNTGHGATFMAKGEVVDWIMDNVGPRPWDRQAHVQRVLDHFVNGTGAQISNQASVGGYPSLAATTATFDPDAWDLETMTPAGVSVVDAEAKLVGRGTIGASGTDLTTASGTTAASGSSFLLCASWENGPTPSAVTDSKGNTYTLLGEIQNPGESPHAAQWLCEDGAGGSGHTATITFDGAAIYGSAHLIEIIGCSGLDKHVQNRLSSPPYTVTTGELSQADELVVAFFAPATSVNPTNHTSPNLEIISSEPDGASYWASAVGALVVNSTDSVVCTFSGDGLSGNPVLSAMTFKVQTASPDPDPDPEPPEGTTVIRPGLNAAYSNLSGHLQ